MASKTYPNWVCNTCELIGSEDQATAHRAETGHEIERLDDDLAAAVAAERRLAGAADLMALARLRRAA